MGIAEKAGQWIRAGSEPADRGKEEEQRVEDAKGEEPEGMAADLQCQTARRPLEDPLGRRGRGPGTGRALDAFLGGPRVDVACGVCRV